jgi:hypothetical protein
MIAPTSYAGEFNIIAVADRDTATPFASAHRVLRPPMTKPTFLTCPPAVTTTQTSEEHGNPGVRPIRRLAPLDQIANTPPGREAAKRRQFGSRPFEIAGVMAPHRIPHLT